VLQFEVKTAKQARTTGAIAVRTFLYNFRYPSLLQIVRISSVAAAQEFLRAAARFRGSRNIGNPARLVAAVFLGKLQTGG
jgi:hypothetical protein